MKKKVLVTGAAGFLGSHVCEFFKKKGWDVVGLDNLTNYELSKEGYCVSEVRNYMKEFLLDLGVEFVYADCRDIHHTQFAGVDFIVHCAAQPTMTLSIKDPLYDFENNAKATLKMLELARHHNIPIVTCSSIHVYGNAGNSDLTEGPDYFVGSPSDEHTPILNGDMSPLHASKMSVEVYTRAYAETYNMRAACFRLTGMYGPRQFAGMNHGWVANFAIRIVKEREVVVFGTDKQVRDVLYAEDAARAFYEWYTNGGKGRVYVIGGGMRNAISIKQCLKLLSNIVGKNPTIKMEPSRFGDLYFFVANHSIATNDFGWTPTTLPQDGLKNLIAWINDNEGLF